MSIIKIGKYYISEEEYNQLNNFIRAKSYQLFPSLYEILNLINTEIKNK